MASSSLNPQCKALVSCKEGLESALVQVDLAALSKELFKGQVISKEVKIQFGSLDHDNLDSRLIVRYVLKHIFDCISADASIFAKFLKVLTKASACTNHVCNLLVAKLDNGDKVENIKSLHLSSETDISFTEDHVPILSEVLSGVTYKWKEIGLSLRLRMSVLAECDSEKTLVLKLNKMLWEWVSGNNIGALPATINNLKQELASEIVGLRVISESLEDRFGKLTELPSRSIEPQAETILELVYQSDDTEVADGKSTLLEVQVNLSQYSSYQWMKDGHSLPEDSRYCGTQSGILAIYYASQSSEGAYSCLVKNGDMVKETIGINLTINYPPAKRRLLNTYLKEKEIPTDLWPPVGTNTFINLALIKSSGDSDATDYTVRGDLDDIVGTKEKLQYKQVFSNFEEGALFLVLGRPGSGKTTFAHRLSKDWAKGNLLKNVNMLFLINLRVLNKSKKNHEDLSDVLELFYRGDKLKEITDDMEVKDGEGICFILDGFDEYQPKEDADSVIDKLIYKTCLPQSMVILTSRPVAIVAIRQEAPISKRIEVIGFAEEQVFEFIDNYPFPQSAGISRRNCNPNDLKEYLSSHPNVLNMCYLPVNASIICFLFSREGKISPRETLIYKQFVQLVILRQLMRKQKKVRVSSLEGLGGPEREYFDALCHLAFTMTIEFTMTFYQSEIPLPLSEYLETEDSITLGLITKDFVPELTGFEQTYSFLHLTLQEFLAAFYLSTLDATQQMKIWKEKGHISYLYTMWKFYYGLVNFEEKFSQLDTSVFKDITESMHFAFESQQAIVCDTVCTYPGTLYFDSLNPKYVFTPSDLNVLGYVISNTSKPVETIIIKSHIWANELGDLLMNIENGRLDHVTHITINSSFIKFCKELSKLISGLCQCKNLQILTLTRLDVRSDLLIAISSHLNQLKELNFSSNQIESDGIVTMACEEKFCSNLTKLNLSANLITSDGAHALCNEAKHFKAIEVLDVSQNMIDPEGIIAIVRGFKTSKTLRELYCTCTGMNFDSARVSHLMEGLHCLDSLQKMTFTVSNSSLEDVTVQLKSLKNKSIQIKPALLHTRRCKDVTIISGKQN